MRVEFSLKVPDVLADTELGVPWELVGGNELLLILRLKFRLGSGQRNRSEGVRCFHAQVDGQLVLPALSRADALGRDRCDPASAHTLGDFRNQTLLGWPASLINGENVGVHLRVLNDHTSNKSGKIDDVNSRH